MNQDERNQKICEMYLSGKTLRETGKAFNISNERVRQILKKCGVPTRKWYPTGRKGPILASRAEEAAKVYAEVGTVCGVANRMAVSFPVARRWLVEAGVTIRNRGSKPVYDCQDAAVADYVNGLGAKEIARKYGCAGITVYLWLKNRGIPRRPKYGREPKKEVA